MAGPNPHKLYSFRELRAIAGKSWVTCPPCTRYVGLPLGLDARDTRVTTFSCSVCGDEGKLVFEDPGKAGLQHDLRRRPRHHPEAVIRLRVAVELRRRDEERAHRERPVRSERPKPEPPVRHTLKPFPCRTFADLATWGLKATVHCSLCRHQAPLVLEDKHLSLPLLRPRLNCSAIIPGTAASEPRRCEGRGALWVQPADLDGVPDEHFVSAWCGHHEHTGLMANYILLDRSPWRDYLPRGVHFSCPVCRKCMGHTWHDTLKKQSGGRLDRDRVTSLAPQS